MAEHELVEVPNPLLARAAATAGHANPDLAADLVDTLQVMPGAMGLAAPQLGVSRRAVCVDVSASSLAGGGDRGHGLIVLFDPELVHAEGSELHRESCSSVPDFTADVVRASRIVVRGLDPEDDAREIDASGIEARALQHQLDHLDGRLILDCLAGVRPAAFRRDTAVRHHT